MTHDAHARKVLISSLIGSTVEWYEFFIYGTAASLVFDEQFFPQFDPLVGTLLALSTFAIAFVARPLGGVVFGHFGDRIGRKRMLILSMTLMGVGSTLIGLLPTYAQIGVWAPILLVLLRIVQGIAVGGEWGGAVTLAVEHAPPEQRGRFAALPQIGSPIGTLLSSGGFYLVAMLPDESFDSWGWRLPFLAAFPLLGVALYLRRRVGESPLFEQMLAEHDRASVPAVELFRTAWRQVLIGIAASLIGIGGFYLLTTFVISYGSGQLGLPKSLMLAATLVAAAAEVLTLIFGGRLADRFSPGKVCLWGGVLSALMAFPVFWMIDTRNPVLVIIAVTLGINCLSIPYAVSGSLLAGLFPVHLRYSGVAISSNLSGTISGFVPLIASALLIASGQQSWSAAALLLVLALITAVGGFFGHRAARTPADGIA